MLRHNNTKFSKCDNSLEIEKETIEELFECTRFVSMATRQVGQYE